MISQEGYHKMTPRPSTGCKDKQQKKCCSDYECDFYNDREHKRKEKNNKNNKHNKHKQSKFTIIKEFGSYPFAHRQHLHDGQCFQIHGHNWKFKIKFGCDELDHNGFVIDFGKLKWIREIFKALFDHTLVVDPNDDQIESFKELSYKGLCNLVVIPGSSAEHLAKFIFDIITDELDLKNSDTQRNVWVQSVEVFEDDDDSAIYELV